MKEKLGKSAATLTLANMVTLLISLVSGMLLSRFRSLEEYGTYSQIIIVVNLTTTLFMLGLPKSISYFLGRTTDTEERRNFISVYYSFTTLLCVLIGVVLVFSVPIIEEYFDNHYIRSFFYVLAVLPWTKVTISGFSNIMVVYGRTKKLMLVNIANACVNLFAIIAVQLFSWNFTEYMIMYILGETAIGIWIYIIVINQEKSVRISFNKKQIRKILAFSIPVGLASFIGTMTIETDKLIIGYLMNTEAVAIYTNAGKELPLVIISSALTAVLLPNMARRLKVGDKEGALEIWSVSIRLSYIIICFFTMACVVFAPQIISILYSNKYLPGVNVFRVYSLVMLLRVTYFGLILNSLGKTKHIFYSSLALLVLNAGMNYLLYMIMGFIGPAISTFLSIAITGILQLVWSSRLLQISFGRIFPWKNLLKITLINLAIGATTFLLVKLLKIGTDIKGNIIALCIGAVILGIYAVFMARPSISLWRELNEDK